MFTVRSPVQLHNLLQFCSISTSIHNSCRMTSTTATLLTKKPEEWKLSKLVLLTFLEESKGKCCSKYYDHPRKAGFLPKKIICIFCLFGTVVIVLLLSRATYNMDQNNVYHLSLCTTYFYHTTYSIWLAVEYIFIYKCACLNTFIVLIFASFPHKLVVMERIQSCIARNALPVWIRHHASLLHPLL